ncbi:hypothetical protein ACIA8O_39810 [Kitasatospora sp. NPDC051853]|uniref:hypothetical protein n=1 Tax=Kitasatospora sp. NPDC051853 TaxID=3364058 RepID=UPI00379B0FF1
MSTRTRAGQHYANNRMFTGDAGREVRQHMSDVAYRHALRLTMGGDLPRSLGNVSHNRPAPKGLPE